MLSPHLYGYDGKYIFRKRTVNEKMEIYVSKKYLMILFILWIAPTISAVWGAPVWVTISLMSFFAIYAGHEWMHIWICRINNMNIERVVFSTLGDTHTLFDEADGPEKNQKEADVYLAGVIWDSFWLFFATTSSLTYSVITGETIPITFGFSLILILIFNLAVPGSDWQEYHKRTSITT